jgi:CRP/FNR family transcriptional regulator
MPFREALGRSSGTFPQAPVHLLNRLPARKPCRSVPLWYVPPLRGKRPQLISLAAAPARINPLFLFYCNLKWHNCGETAAGWELVQAMRSNNRGARALAAELMSATEDSRLLVRDLRRTRSALSLIAKPDPPSLLNSQPAETLIMNTPYGLPMVENCHTCPLRRPGWFCHLSPDVLHSFSASSHLSSFPGGAILFVEGQMPRGAYVLCAGRVKLSTTSKEGKVLVLKIAAAGEVIGLSALVSGDAYEITAETLEPTLVNFVERNGLLRLMERSGELGLRSAQAVSREFQYAYREIHELILARSSSEKLARLLLSWINSTDTRSALRIHAPITHEEMAQRIGASRETVTRLLSELKKRDLISLEGSTLVIKNRTALEALAV